MGAPPSQGLPPDLQPTEVNVTNDLMHRWGEPNVAVNPRNPNNLVYNVMLDSFTYACQKAATPDCTMIKVIPPNRTEPMDTPRGLFQVTGWLSNRVYVSFDRGRTWKLVEIPRKIDGNRNLSDATGGDPVVRASSDGTFWISWEPIHIGSFPLDAPGNYGCPVVSKSTDGGRTWSNPVCTGTPVDHEWIEIDQSTGTLYEASSGHLGPTSEGEANLPVGAIGDRWLVTSKDGVHWSSPPQRFGGSDGAAQFPGGGRMVASNGVLATAFSARSAPACRFFLGSGDAPCTVFQTTSDAGAHWTRHRVPAPADPTGGFQMMLTGNPKKPGHYTLALMDAKAGQFMVYRTADSGATWSGPTRVTEDASKTHFKAAMAASPSGVIGMMWRTRQSGTPMIGPYNVWATISDDEGATFSQPLKISSADSPGEDPALPFGFDDLSDINLNDQYAFIAWADWRPGDRSGYFSAVKLRAFRHHGKGMQ